MSAFMKRLLEETLADPDSVSIASDPGASLKRLRSLPAYPRTSTQPSRWSSIPMRETSHGEVLLRSRLMVAIGSVVDRDARLNPC